MSLLAAVGWKVVPRIRLGPLGVSPHGLGIAVGYAAGGALLARRAERLHGIAREHVWNMLMWAVVGVIVGARLFFVVGHADEYWPNVLDAFKVWQGGIVLYGGIFGGILAGYPYARKHRLPFAKVLDAAAPCFALGLIFGRIGDLAIGDHLGAQTNFFLGWRYEGGELPDRSLVVGQVVHQTALYDLIVVAILFPLLLRLGRRARPDGWLITVAGVLYACGRFVTDFARTQAPELLGLHGTQWMSLAIIAFGAWFLARRARAGPGPAPLPDDDAAAEMIWEGGPVFDDADGSVG